MNKKFWIGTGITLGVVGVAGYGVYKIRKKMIEYVEEEVHKGENIDNFDNMLWAEASFPNPCHNSSVIYDIIAYIDVINHMELETEDVEDNDDELEKCRLMFLAKVYDVAKTSLQATLENISNLDEITAEDLEEFRDNLIDSGIIPKELFLKNRKEMDKEIFKNIIITDDPISEETEVIEAEEAADDKFRANFEFELLNRSLAGHTYARIETAETVLEALGFNKTDTEEEETPTKHKIEKIYEKAINTKAGITAYIIRVTQEDGSGDQFEIESYQHFVQKV